MEPKKIALAKPESKGKAAHKINFFLAMYHSTESKPLAAKRSP